MINSIVLGLSGGMDSTTVLAWSLNKGYQVRCLAFDYGSKHSRYELQSALRVSEHYRVPVKLIDLSTSFENFESALLKTGGEIPEGHYEDESMKDTIVPCRNLILLSYLAGFAESKNFGFIGIGIHRGDRSVYPDCREEFFESMNQTIFYATDGAVEISAPFLMADKVGILEWGLKHNVPYHLTRTCYKDQELSCGKCGACTERLEAFEKMGVEDPILYYKK